MFLFPCWPQRVVIPKVKIVSTSKDKKHGVEGGPPMSTYIKSFEGPAITFSLNACFHFDTLCIYYIPSCM